MWANKTQLRMLLATTIASSMFALSGVSQTTKTSQPQPVQGSSNAPATTESKASTSAANWHVREGQLYRRNWGVDIAGVRTVSAGEMLVFRFRVLDAAKAKELTDKKNAAVLIDEATGIKLSVPQMEKVGLLRTTIQPNPNGMYWMVFGNASKVVKRGSRVSIVIGKFRVDGLTVE
jgi:hypothetical protein